MTGNTPAAAGTGGPPDIRGTVWQAFERSVAQYAERDFLCILPETADRYGIAAHTYSYEAAAREVSELRRRYEQAGLGHGHRAGLLLENRPAMFFHWLALNGLGVSVVPINPEWRSAELEYLVSHSEIAVAVAPDSRGSDLTRAASAAGARLIVTSPDLTQLERVMRPIPQPNVPPDAQTECALLYTSGTTGRPKGCVLTNEYFLWAGTWYGALGGMCSVRPGAERLITPLPMSHMNAMAVSTMAMLSSGGCIVPLDRFHPATWWRSVHESRASIVHYLGVMPAMLLGAAPGAQDRGHALRFGFGAGVS
ncbi:MAG TPA: AMP-binding protein, partial [Steroidobacteraceae bacterium]|nr:AMP-binding protein [Steroidobacteraceae bacterium]